MPLPLGFPGSDDALPEWLQGAQYQTPTQALDPNEIAALRQRNAVRPPLGRQEGAATQFVEDTFGLPKTPVDAAALFALGGPAGRVGTKALALGLGGLLSSGGEAEAGPLAAIRKGIKAYHGSPHDFERFDLSKIGTGEGAQAYGHGLYFAENPAVAQSYKMANAPTYQNTHIANLAYEAQRAAEAATGLRGEAAKPAALKWLQGEAERATPYQRQNFHDAMNNYDAVMRPPTGKMYEVNINAAPEQFLDWDKPLMEQSPTVLNTVADLAAANRVPLGNSVTGEAAYRRLDIAGDPNRKFINPSKEAATAALREAGIPGIKYLDQGSRGVLDLDSARRSLARAETRAAEFANSNHPNAPDQLRMYQAEIARHKKQIAEAEANPPTSNYVLFRDDIIDILRKYGLAGLAQAAGAAATAGQEAPLPMSMPQSQ